MPRRTAAGPELDSRPKRSGNSLRAAASRARPIRGATSCCRADATAATSGRVRSRPVIPAATAIPARRRARIRTERLRSVQRRRKRLGVVRGLVLAQLSSCHSWRGPTLRDPHRTAGDAWRLVPLPSLLLQPLPRRRTQLQYAREHHEPLRIPGGDLTQGIVAAPAIAESDGPADSATRFAIVQQRAAV